MRAFGALAYEQMRKERAKQLESYLEVPTPLYIVGGPPNLVRKLEHKLKFLFSSVEAVQVPMHDTMKLALKLAVTSSFL